MGEAHKMITAVAITRRALGMAIIVNVTRKERMTTSSSVFLISATLQLCVHTGCRAAMATGVLRNPHWLSAASGKEGAGRHRP